MDGNTSLTRNKKKRNDIADVAWGLGFILLATIGVIANYNFKTLVGGGRKW